MPKQALRQLFQNKARAVPLFMPFPVRLCLAWFAVAVAFVTALCLGAQDYPLSLLWQMLGGHDATDPAQVIVAQIRLPRAVAAVVIGAALAVSGLIMQAVARNPLADPGLTGVNAGAALAVVGGLWGIGALPQGTIAGLALLGAGVSVIVVRMLAGGGDNSLRLPLAGAAFASLCMALVAFVVLLNPDARSVYRYWMVGSLAIADAGGLMVLTPIAVLGIALAILVARQIETLMLGAEIGAALGLRPGRVIGLALAAITLTAGASVALAGPVGFIGLIAPHLARRIASGKGMTAATLMACPVGAGMALIADTLGRWLIRPSELPLGVVLAMVGAPAFMLLVRRMLRAPE